MIQNSPVVDGEVSKFTSLTEGEKKTVVIAGRLCVTVSTTQTLYISSSVSQLHYMFRS